MRDFGDNVFSGAAEYYAKYRPAYPNQLFDDIIGAFNLSGQGRLLDLGCGTGEMAIPLAPKFKNVLAIDPDEQMLEYGAGKANTGGITNIMWQKGSSKTLTEVKPPFLMVTMGRSFHWTDQRPVLDTLYGLLQPSGGVVIVSGGGQAVEQNARAAKKDKIVKQIVAKYLGPDRRAGDKIYVPGELDWEKNLFPKSRFGNYQTANYVVQVSLNTDQIIGQLFSMSWAVRRHFGNRVIEFEDELRHELNRVLGAKEVIENYRFSVYILVKK